LRQPQVYHRLQAIKAEITAGPFGVAGWQAEEEVEEDLMDRMVVEGDCIVGGIDNEAPDRKQILSQREVQGVLDFGQQIKTEGNEAFANENWEGALTRYCQGDQMMKNFRAEPHLERENKELRTMHRQCLGNKANAALKMDKWNEALHAAEDALRMKNDDEKALFRKAMALEGLGRTDEALAVLDEVEEIANDMDEDCKEAMLEDIKERKEVLQDIEKRAAQDYAKLFKKLGDKEVFGAGRFLPDGTSRPPALTGAQERKLKLQQDREEYLEAKAKHAREQRKLQGLPMFEPRKDPELPTPNKPPLSHMRFERSRAITQKQAEQLLEELMAVYSGPDFQKKVHADAKAVMYEYVPFVKRLKKIAFVVQEPILRKWGFDPTEEGLNEMLVCLSDHTLREKRLRDLADECTKMLHGGEDGMWGMESET